MAGFFFSKSLEFVPTLNKWPVVSRVSYCKTVIFKTQSFFFHQGSLLSKEIVYKTPVCEIVKALLLSLKQGGGPSTEGIWYRKQSAHHSPQSRNW